MWGLSGLGYRYNCTVIYEHSVRYNNFGAIPQTVFSCRGSGGLGQDAFDALDQVYETADFVADELGSDEVRDSLGEVAQLFEWIDNDSDKTFFELQIAGGKISNQLAGVKTAFCKAFVGGMLISVIYLERRRT